MARREKEEELIFRGLQYSRALRLFATKYANASPPNLDVLVEQRFIRKKYKDPITNDDFQPVLAGQAVPGTTTPPLDSRRQFKRRHRTRRASRGANPAPAATAQHGRARIFTDWHSGRRCDRRRDWRRQQEQGHIDSPVQRSQSLQRVGFHQHAASAGAGRGRRRDQVDAADAAALEATTPPTPTILLRARTIWRRPRNRRTGRGNTESELASRRSGNPAAQPADVSDSGPRGRFNRRRKRSRK